MKILIVSDTHGYSERLERVMEREIPIDMLVHCGDVGKDVDYIPLITPSPLYMVAGNNDWGSGLSNVLIANAGRYRIFITHGHAHWVECGLDRLVSAAKANKADIVMFGHTHVPVLEKMEGIMVVNPGSLTYPRQEGRKATYAVMEIGEDGKIDADIKFF